MARGLSSLLNRKLALSLALALAIGASLPRPAAAQTRSDAPGYLDLAIREFQAGRPARSAELLSAARGLDPELGARRPDAYKLSGWLAWLHENRQREALPAFLQYLESRPGGPDAAFLWYLVGGTNLSDRGDALRAGRAYRRAAEIGAAARPPTVGPGGEPKRDLLLWPELTPVACPADPVPVSRNSKSSRSGDWLSVRRGSQLPAVRYAELWNRRLLRSEVALAAFGALASGAGAAKRNRLRGILDGALDDPATRAELGEPLVRLLLASDETATPAFEACAQLLATAERHELNQIARGLLTPAQTRLKRIRGWTARLHKTRVQSQRSARSLYRYGVWLLAQARALPAKNSELASVRRLRLLQALHALRQSLAAAGQNSSEGRQTEAGVRLHLLSPGLRLQPDAIDQLRVQTQILYRLAECYELAGRRADSDALRRVAQSLAGLTGQLSAPVGTVVPVDSMDPTERTADFVYARCRENMRVRECLEILIAAAKDGAPGLRTPAFYQDSLNRRDESFSEEELLFVFAP